MIDAKLILVVIQVLLLVVQVSLGFFIEERWAEITGCVLVATSFIIAIVVWIV